VTSPNVRRRNVLCGLLVLLLGCRAEAPPPTPRPTPAGPRRARMLVVGMDGLEPSLVRRLLAEGRLPHFRRLIERGTFTEITCDERWVSPVAWTSVATGVPPAEHGIRDFVSGGKLVDSTLRQRAAAWNILTHAGLKVATVGWFVTWPAEPASGLIVSDRAYWAKEGVEMQPPGLVAPEELRLPPGPPWPFLAQFTDYPFDPAYRSLPKKDPRYAVNFLIEQRLLDVYLRDEFFAAAARKITPAHDLDVLLTYYSGADYTGHGFWKYFEPEPFRKAGQKVDPDEVARLKDVIPRYYDHLDHLLGRALEQVDPQALVVVLSDHGFGTALGEFRTERGDYLSGNHRFKAVLIVSGPGVARDAQPARTLRLVDVLPTMLYALKLPLARDLAGTPMVGLFDERFRAERRPVFVDSYEASRRPTGAPPRAAGEERVMETLRSLGYIK
jgi:predicted AlkP superfamily phosphohydrolase/phosphomutase